MIENRQWVLARRPRGKLTASDFNLLTSAVPELNDGEVLIKTLMLSFDPAMRGWVDDRPSYIPPVAIGDPMRASGVGQVIESKNIELPVGTLVAGFLGWQEYSLSGGDKNTDELFPLRVLPAGTPESLPLSVFGGTGLTAYFGLMYVGQPIAGETVLVSGAAGATGSVAAQIAKIQGCEVVAIAGGQEKCQWLKNACGVDKVIDYKADDLDQKLTEFCPEGIHVFFDNVGGDILQIALNHMADFGRVVMCGAIAVYNDELPRSGPNNLTQIIVKRLRVQGFTTLDYWQKKDQALADIQKWVAAGQIIWREDIVEGFENIPDTLNRLFDGRNKGKQLLRLASPEIIK